MPELPEAETIARGLRPFAVGRTIDGVTVHHPDLLDLAPDEFRALLFGGAPNALPSAPLSASPGATHSTAPTICDVTRRGKNVVLPLESGLTLVVNLGMSGRLLWRPADDPTPPPSHPAVTFHLGGDALVYHDPRRFGRIQLLSPNPFAAWSRALGPEPLDPGFTPPELALALSQSRSPIRSWLLDQRRIAGVGNIYAVEACHRAGIHPLTPARAIDAAGAARLHGALIEVLRRAIERGGTTLRDYRTAQGWEGAFQHDLGAYGRDGLPCPTCATPVERLVFSNRSAFVCPTCQPAP
jgi:formamidopyrimidine-DNA glycosylase